MAQSITQFPPNPNAAQVQQNQSPPPMPPTVAAAIGGPMASAASSQMPTPPPSGIIPGTEGGVRGPANLPMHRLSGGAFASDAFTLPGNEAPASPTGQSSGTGDPTYDAITRLISNRLMGPQFYGMGGHLFTEPDVGTGLLTRLAEQRSANQAQLESARIGANAHTEAARIQSQGQGQLSPAHQLQAVEQEADRVAAEARAANNPLAGDRTRQRQIARQNLGFEQPQATTTQNPTSTASPAATAAAQSATSQSPLQDVVNRLLQSTATTPQAALAGLHQAMPNLPEQAFAGNNWPQIMAALQQRFPNLRQQIAPPSPLLATTPGINIISRMMDPAFVPFGRLGAQPTQEQIWLNTLRQTAGR